MIKLPVIVYEPKARNGEWCTLPYPGHKKGCPNYPKCIHHHQDFTEIDEQCKREWFAVMVEFDLWAHVEYMKNLHPTWTTRQCKNLLYWQGKVRDILKRKAYAVMDDLRWTYDLLEIPEAHGINVFTTMELAGVKIERNPDTVRKVMFVGRRIGV